MSEENIIKLKESEVEVIDVNEAEIVDIELEEVFGTVDEANNALNHALLHNRDIQDQHPITAITGLRAELDEIESLKTVYSDEKQQADYYLWHDENPLFENRDGFFVSMHKDVEHNTFHSALCCIEICDGSQDVFGVTVAEAGFVGGQEYVQADGGAKIGRDRKYGLVVHSGLVGVRRETNVAIGDYVVPNTHGVAEKSDGDYGYLVTALSEVNGVQYAIISLVAPSTLAKIMSDNVQDLNERMTTAEYNITSVTNVANSAYVMALDAKENAEVSSEYIKEKVEEVLGRMDAVDGVIGNLSESVNGASADAAAARAIANSAVSSANTMKDEAVGKANEALDETSKTKTELEEKIEEIKADLDNIDIEELQEIKESIESTLDQLQSDLNSVTSELENTKTNLNNTRDELSANIDKVSTDLNNELNETKSNFEALEDDLEPLVMWPEDTEASDATGIAGFIARANKDSTTLGELVKWKGETNTAIAGVTQTANDNKASIDTITLWKGETDESLATVSQKADNNSTSIQSLTSWQNNASESITKVEQKANANESSIQSLTEWKDGATQSIANIEEKSNANESSILLLTTWKSDVEDDVESIAAIKTQSNANKSAIESLTSWKEGANASLTSIKQQSDANKASIDEITLWQGATNESISQIKQQADDNSASLESLASWKDIDVDSIAAITQRVDDAESEIETLTSRQNDATTAIANVEQKANANETKINSLTSWQGTTNTAIAHVEQKATANESSINSLTSWKDETSESITAIKQTADKNSAEISTIASWKSDVEEDVSSIASIESIADANKASIEELVKKDTELSTTIAGVKTTADANKAEIEEIASWKSKVDPTINSVASIKQTADGNAAKIEGLTAWQGTTNTSMAQLQQKADENGAYIQGFVSNINKYSYGPYSQAHRFTYEEALNILEEGTVYVPDANHSVDTYRMETYEGTDGYDKVECGFLKGYYYTWKVAPNDTSENPKPKWIPSLSTAVTFSSAHIIGNDATPYWVATADITLDDGTVYEKDCLYKWDVRTIDGIEYKNWVKVASLQGNLSTVTTSIFKQTSNSIETAVTDINNNYAGTKDWVDDNKAAIQDVVTWHGDNGDSLVTFMQEAGDNFASASQVAKIVDKDGNIKAASIVTAVNESGSSVTIDADHIQFTGQKLNIKVDSTNIDGTLTIGQLPDTVAETDDIPTKTSDLTNDSGFQNTTGVVTIAKGAITADYIKTLNLEVGNQITMGKNATISWDSVTGTDDIASKSDVSNAKSEAIATASNDATSKANDAKSSAVSEIEQKGYQTKSQVTKITNDTISTTNVVAQNLQVKAANIEGALTATQIDVDNLSAISANMGTVTAGEIQSSNCRDRVYTWNANGSLTQTDFLYDIKQPAGLYKANGERVATWDTLVNTYGMKVDIDYSDSDYQTTKTSPYYIFYVNEASSAQLSGGVKLIISNDIDKIGGRAFAYCENLISVVIGDSVTSIGYRAFWNCSSLTSVTIGDSVTSIGGQAFAYCSGLTSITIPDSVTSIGDSAFFNCSKLANMMIGDGITSIKSYAFSGVPSSLQIYYTGEGKVSGVETGGNTSFTDTTNKYYYSGSRPTDSDKQYWTTSPESGFKLSCDNENMIDSKYFKVTKDGKVTATDVNLSGKITATSGEIGGCTISDDGSIVSANGNFKVDATGNLTASNSDITGKITATSGEIGGCTINTDGSIVSANGHFQVNAAGNLTATDVDLSGKITATSGEIGGLEITEQTIQTEGYGTVSGGNPFGALGLTYELLDDYYIVKNVGTCSNTILEIPGIYQGKPVREIASNAFTNNIKITKVTIPNSVINIGASAFKSCSQLNTVILGDSVKAIGDNAFEQCSNLSSITIPDSVVSIGNYAFNKCVSATALTIGSNVASVGKGAFGNLHKLSSVIVPESITSISQEMFAYCYSLENIFIPESVVSIGTSAFYLVTDANHETPGASLVTPKIYYKGTPVQWQKISISDTQNGPLVNANIYYYRGNDKIRNSDTQVYNYWNDNTDTGFKISNNGKMIDSKYFKVSKNGIITAKQANLEEVIINNGVIKSSHYIEEPIYGHTIQGSQSATYRGSGTSGTGYINNQTVYTRTLSGTITINDVDIVNNDAQISKVKYMTNISVSSELTIISQTCTVAGNEVSYQCEVSIGTSQVNNISGFSFIITYTGSSITEYKALVGGMISLEDAPFLKYPYFSINMDGKISATGGEIGPFIIEENGLIAKYGDTIISPFKIAASKIETYSITTSTLEATVLTSAITPGGFSSLELTSYTRRDETTVKISVSYDTEEYEHDIWGTIQNPGNVRITATAETNLLATKIITVQVVHSHYNYATNPTTETLVYEVVNIVIEANTNSGYVDVVHVKKKNGHSCTFDEDKTTLVTKSVTQYTFVGSSPVINCTGDFRPVSGGRYKLGESTARWKEIWCTQNSLNSSSDRNLKNSIEIIPDKYDAFYDAISPVRYKFNDGESDRYHIGFIAQEVRDALDKAEIDSKEFAGYLAYEKDDGTMGYGLRYGEFIALNTQQIQKLKAEVKQLKQELAELKIKQND